MCASYGLGGGAAPLPLDLEPMSEQGPRALLSEWMEQRQGSAKITGQRAKNLNPIIRADETGDRSLELAWWSIPRPSGDGTAFNSKVESLLRYWKAPFQTRAILPATWYIEKGAKFGLPDAQTFGVAAIASSITDRDGIDHVAYSMVTRAAIGEAADTWHRMPLVLPRDMHDEWLALDRPGDESLVAAVRVGSDEISRALTAA